MQGLRKSSFVVVAQGNTDRDSVLAETDLVGLIGEQLRLEPKSDEFVGLCPFHEDSKPSMYVVPRKGFFHCFACGEHGNAIDFMMKYHHMEFREALENLATRAGIELSRQTASGKQAADRRSQLFRANKLAAKFFARTLNDQDGEVALQNLKERGISSESIEKFGLGAAPDSWDGLIQNIRRVHDDLAEDEKELLPSREIFEAAGLLRINSRGDHNDYFRNRVIFPIRDQLGRPIAFGARKIRPEDEPKYLNSPETDIFTKGETLFGYDLAVKSIARTRTAIVCEGYTDVIALHAFGFDNAVATLGTALTRKHADSLARICDRVVLLFDGDAAGIKATRRAAETFFAAPVDIAICTLPDGMDPDDFLRGENGTEMFQAAVDSAPDALTSMLKGFREELDTAEGITARTRIVEQTIDKISSLGINDISMIRRGQIIEAISRIVGLEQRELERLNVRRPSYRVGEASSDASEPVSAPEPLIRAPRARRLAEESLIRLFLGDTSLLWVLVTQEDESEEAPGNFFAPADFQDPVCNVIWKTLLEHTAAGKEIAGSIVIGEIIDQEAGHLAGSLFIEGHRLLSKDGFDSREHLVIACNDLSAAIRQQQRTTTRMEVKARTISDAEDAARALEAIRNAGDHPSAIPRETKG